MIAPSDSDLVDQTQEIISVIYACVSLWQKHTLMEMPSLYGKCAFIMIYVRITRAHGYFST